MDKRFKLKNYYKNVEYVTDSCTVMKLKIEYSCTDSMYWQCAAMT